jgi:hypothetical protein
MIVSGPAGIPGGQEPGRPDPSMDGPEGNARLTGTVAAVLVLLLAAEGVTVLSVRSLVAPHVFIGMLLIPPVTLKIGSTIYRFARFYR